MKIVKEDRALKNELLRESYFDFDNKELSTFIYENNYQTISFGMHEFDPEFLKCVFKKDSLDRLLQLYLHFLEKDDNEKYNKLKHGEGFYPNEVLTSFSEDIKRDYSRYQVILQTKKEFDLENNAWAMTPLEEAVQNIYFKNFCDGLRLTLTERKFLLLVLLNHEWRWLFPDRDNYEYNSVLLIKICGVKAKSAVSFARKLNNKFINLGLFSGDWELANFAYAFFRQENPSFSLQKVRHDSNRDFYDLEKVFSINEREFLISRAIADECQESGKGCWQSVQGQSDYRNKNLLALACKKFNKDLYELKEELPLAGKKEFCFYLYALSVSLCKSNSIIFVGKELAQKHLLCDEDSRKTHGAGDSLLRHIKCQAVVSLDGLSAEQKQGLKDAGADIYYDITPRLPPLDSQLKEEELLRIARYFASKTPLVAAAVDECVKLKLDPQKWEEVAELSLACKRLGYEEAVRVIEKKFAPRDDGNIRKNSHYCLEALNTSVPSQSMIDALKNAADWQREHPDDESGVRIELSGPSGTGKTAFVEQTAKLMNKPLKIARASDILNCYVGETEKNIKAIFDGAAKEDAILLIDEADSFLSERGDALNRFNDRMTNEFLVQMERFKGILFCNTNLPQSLDKATDRRFHFKVDFMPLTKEGVALLCKSYFASYEISEKQVEKIFCSGDVTPGDFGALNGRVRFMDKSAVNADYITDELCKIVKGKTRDWENKRQIGFGA